MISPLAKGDYEDLLAAGLPATLEDFDRLNQIALRLTSGAETTLANHPRIGWAGDVPFHQPTCAAFAWYLEYADRGSFDKATKDACWFFALAHARDAEALRVLSRPSDIVSCVNKWLAALPVTLDEVTRACRYAAVGFDDAVPGKTDAQTAADAAKTDAERTEDTISNITERVTVAAAATGIPPRELERETPSRLDAMILAAKRLHKCDEAAADASLRADYDLTFREIRKRLIAEKEASNGR